MKIKQQIIVFLSFLHLCAQVNAHRDVIITGIGVSSLLSCTGLLYKNYQNESLNNPLIKKQGFIHYLKNNWKKIHSKDGLHNLSLINGLALTGEIFIT